VRQSKLWISTRSIPVGVGQREHLRQGRDPVVPHHFRVGKLVEELAAVERPELGQRQLVDQLADIGVLRVAR
jgi:hypothetical protein